MTPAEAMNAKLDAAGLRTARLAATADKVHTVVDKARKLTDLPDVEGEDSMLFWESYGALRDAVQALDGTRLADMIRASERIVRTGGVEVFDICHCRPEDACVACSDIPPTLLENRAAEVARHRKRTPAAWSLELGIEVLDPDGWDRQDFNVDWWRPLTREEFEAKVAISTIRRKPAAPQNWDAEVEARADELGGAS